MDRDRRTRRRRALSVVLAGLSALLLAMLAVATNLATNEIPTRFKHLAEDPRLSWGATGILVVLVVAVGVIYQRLSAAQDNPHTGSVVDDLDRVLAGQTADQAIGRLARLRDQLPGLPQVVRPEVERDSHDDPQGVEDVVVSVSDPDRMPAESIRAWIEAPPTWMGDQSSPRHPVAWSMLGELAAAYGESGSASTAFERAAGAAAGGRRIYWLARAAWEAYLSGDGDRAAAVVAVAGNPEQNPEPLMRVMAALHALLAHNAGHSLPTPDHDHDVVVGPVATQDLDQEDARLRDVVRRELTSWAPSRPVDRDLAARIAAQVEVTDGSRSWAERFTTVLRVLNGVLDEGWIDDTGLLMARLLCWRVGVGGAGNRAKDLARAQEIAVTVRDRYRFARRDSRVAVREAVLAAVLAGRLGQAIELGSARFGTATLQEAHDPDTARAVFEAALEHDLEVAQALADDPDQLPEGFVRAWAQAKLVTHRLGRNPQDRQPSIAVWQQVFHAANTDDERRQALAGLAEAGAEDLPQLDELLAGEEWMADQLRARSALIRGDAPTAIRLTLPHRRVAAAAAALLADAYIEHGQLDAAVTTLQEAAGQFDLDDLIVHAARACARQGQTARAERLIETVVRTGAPAWSGRPRALALLGELQAGRGAWREAIASWTTVLEEDPYAEQVRWQLAGAHERRGDHDAGWSVLTSDPDHEGGTRPPPDPPTAGAAHLLLLLLFRQGELIEVVRRGIDFLDRFQDDGEVAGRIMGLLLTSTAEDAVELPPDLENQLRAAFAAAAARNPSSRAVRVISGPPEQLLRQMIELSRPAPDQVRTVEECALRVLRGQLPLGTLAMVAGRSYGQCVVDKVGGVLTAVGDQAEHDAGIADAQSVLGIQPTANYLADAAVLTGPVGAPGFLSVAAVPVAEVVTDASTLYVRGLLPNLDNSLTVGVRDVLLADEAFIDLLLAQDHFASSSTDSLHVDAHTGNPSIHTTNAATRLAHRQAIQRMVSLAELCQRWPEPVTSHPDLDRLRGERAQSWLSGLRLAHGRNAAVWSDDVALRQLARGVGLPAFSTTALLETYLRLGRVTADVFDAAIGTMIRGNVGDFAPNLPRARRLAAEPGDARGAILGAISKPAFWAGTRAASTVCAALVADLNVSDQSIVADLVHVAVLGICRTMLAESEAVHLGARVLAIAMIAVGSFGDVPSLLAASRTASTTIERTLPDLLPRAVSEVLSVYERTVSPAIAADQLRALVSRCAEDDVATVRRTILGRR
jgi:tetratricopeptide (TPR) repeat protein